MSNLEAGKKYTRYKTATGEITGQFGASGNDQPFSNFVGDDESYIEGEYLATHYKIVNGAAVTVGVSKLREQAISEMKAERRDRLYESDWTQGEDSPLSTEKKAEWATYRQALRDLPDSHTNIINIDDVVWPEEPE
tara:strand:+ start:1495 stop:1902 length:408 start_codon:yes stop_codon:yes gene_type:complete